MTEQEKRFARRVKIASAVFCGAVFLIVGTVLVTGDIKVEAGQEVIKIRGSYWGDCTVKTEDIKNVTLTDEFQPGKRTGGFGSYKLREGHFKNEEFGAYTLYAYVKCKEFIVMETTDRMVVVNAETKEETEILYQRIEEAVKRNR